jgi:hypothetical protein
MNRRLRAIDSVSALTASAINEAMAAALGKTELYPYALLLLEALAELDVVSPLGIGCFFATGRGERYLSRECAEAFDVE